MTPFFSICRISAAALALSLSVNPLAARECTFEENIFLKPHWAGQPVPLYPPEMSFSNYIIQYLDIAGPKLDRVIMADGVIVGETANKFRNFLRDQEREQRSFPEGTFVYLNSPGGNLAGGLDLGRLIREKRFNTAIGTEPKFSIDGAAVPDGGACLSACTFTFLGGVERQVHGTDIYGVHRFHFDGAVKEDLVDEAQKLGGALLAYVREMGVDQGLIEDMTASGPDRINHLPIARLRQLHVTTSSKLLDGKLPAWISCK